LTKTVLYSLHFPASADSRRLKVVIFGSADITGLNPKSLPGADSGAVQPICPTRLCSTADISVQVLIPHGLKPLFSPVLISRGLAEGTPEILNLDCCAFAGGEAADFSLIRKRGS
jgi:hypothetical protein